MTIFTFIRMQSFVFPLRLDCVLKGTARMYGYVCLSFRTHNHVF